MIGTLASLSLLFPSCYLPPVTAAVVDPFRAPACSFCAGNRGLEYRPAFGSPVVAAAPGRVRFSGVVAGVRYVVVAQIDGRVATYGRLAAARLSVGAAVASGQIVGAATERFFFGLRADNGPIDRYIDPAPFLGRLRFRPRLVPVDGSAPRPAPPPTLRCGTSA